MNLLHLKLSSVSQIPRHLFGMGPNPSSLKLLDSGQAPDTRHSINKKRVHTWQRRLIKDS